MNIKRTAAMILSSVITFTTASNVFAWTEYYGDATDPERTQLESIMDSIYSFDVGDFTGSAHEEETSEVIELICLTGMMSKQPDGFFHSDAKLAKDEFYTAISLLHTGTINAKPNILNENISMMDSLKAVVSAVGYEYKITEESQFLSVATELALFKGLSFDAGKAITRGEFAQLLYNALQVNPMELKLSTDGMTLEENEDVVLNTIFDIYEIEGLYNSVPGLNVYGGNPSRDGYIEIDRQSYKSGDEFIDNGLLGRYVRGFAKYDEDNQEYIMLYMQNTQKSIEFTLEDIESVEGGRIEYTDGSGKQKKVKISDASNIIYNGDKIQNLDKLSEIIDEHGSVLVSPADGKSDYNVVVIRHYSDFVINSVLSYDEKISFMYNGTVNGLNTVSAVPDDDKYIKVFLDGRPSTIYELKSNQAVSVITNLAGDFIEIYASTVNVSGNVLALDEEGNVTIDKDVYKISPKYRECVQNSPEKAAEINGNSNGVFYVTADGWIAGFKSRSAETYAVIISVIDDDEFDNIRLKVFTEDSTFETLDLASNVTIDGTPFKNRNEIALYLRPYLNKEYKAEYDYNNDGQPEADLVSVLPIISYRNSASGVRKLETAMGEDITFNGMYKGDDFDWMGLSSMIIKGGSGEIKHRTSEETLSFIIPESKAPDEYYIERGNSPTLKSLASPLQFFNEDNFFVADYIVCESGKKAVDDTAKKTLGTVFYVEKTGEMYNEEEEEVTKTITGVAISDTSILNGKRTTYEISKDLEEVVGFEKGNIYNLSIKQGKIYSAALFYDKNDREEALHRYETSTRVWGAWFIARVEDIDPSTGWILVSYNRSDGRRTTMSAKIKSNCMPVRLIDKNLEYVGTGAIQKGDLIWGRYARSNLYSILIINE